MIAAALAVVALSGCSTGGATSTTATKAPAAATKAPAATPTVPPVQTAEDRFWADFIDTPGLSSGVSRSDTLGVAHSLCSAAGAGNTREKIVSTMTSTDRYDEASASVMADLALKHLCPGVSYAVAPPVPAGPATTISSTGGVYEVGVDIVAGKWKTSGEGKCYWSRKKNDDSQDIISNHYQAGPAAVSVKAGELFETQNCGTWTHQG